MMCVQEQILLSMFPPIFFFSRSLSKIHKCNHQRTTIERMCMTQSNVLSFSDWIKKRIHKAKKKENLSIERHSRLFYICMCIQEPWTAIRTGRCRIKWDITSIRKTVCSFFLIPLFFILFDSYLDYIHIFCFFFSHAICCSNTHLWRSNPERTLNCNDGERDSVYMYITRERE